jgi:hypothetical protein
MYFNGVNAYVDTPLLQDSVTSYTIMVWIRTDARQGVVVQDRGDGPGKSITLAIAPSCGIGRLCPNSQFGVPAVGLDSDQIWIGVNATRRVDDGMWHNTAGVFSSYSGQSITPSNFKIYVDGVYVSGATDQVGSWTSPCTGQYGTKIAYHKAWSLYLRAYIAQVLIYNQKALSQAEIVDNISSPDNPIKDNLVLWLQADPTYIKDIDGDGILEWLDLSGYNNHGKIYGATLVQLVKPHNRILTPTRVLPPVR